jgi:DNA-binding NarL/FixJ family response regulator
MIGSLPTQGDGLTPGDTVAVVVLTSDLMTHSQIASAAGRVGVGVKIVASSKALVEACRAADRGPPRAVILDLSHLKIEVAEEIARLRKLVASGTKIVAFGPHVHEKLLAEAAAAGCDAVMARGAFLAQLDSLLKALAAAPSDS